MTPLTLDRLDAIIPALSPTLPTTLRQVADSIDPDAPDAPSYADVDRDYLYTASDDILTGTATAEQVDDAIHLAKEYQR